MTTRIITPLLILLLLLPAYASAQEAGETRTIEDLNMTFVWCPPGTATLGAAQPGPVTANRFGGHPSWYTAEHPQHTETIRNGFWIGQLEVTRAQWEALMKTVPWMNRGDSRNDGTLPATNMTYQDCEDFVDLLNEKTGLRFRIPTEAEWEYAARAGSTTAFYFGDTMNELNRHAWWAGNSQKQLQAAGSKAANPWGLHDVIGNAAEWTASLLETKLSSDMEPLGRHRVIRGGAVKSSLGAIRHSWRLGRRERSVHPTIGLRLLLED